VVGRHLWRPDPTEECTLRSDLNACDTYGVSLAHRAREGPSKEKANPGKQKEVVVQMGVTQVRKRLAFARAHVPPPL
jgi:hypothetical protein